MKPKRILSFLLATAMTISLLPTFTLTASAGETPTTTTEKNITLDTSALSGYDSTNGYKYVYYGTYGGNPIKWRILSMNGNDGTYYESTPYEPTTPPDSADLEDGKVYTDSDEATKFIYLAKNGKYYKESTSTPMFLLSEYGLKQMPYESAWDIDDGDGQTEPSDWRYSDAWNWCNDTFISSSFTDSEKAYFLKTSKANSYTEDYTDELKGDTFFFISTAEAENIYNECQNLRAYMVTSPNGSAVWWWLRSPFDDSGVDCVDDDGEIYYGNVEVDLPAARPAFNLNPASVLFTSAKGVKTIDEGKIKKNENYEPGTDEKYEYKLTMLDESRKDFSVTKESATGKIGKTITLNYDKAHYDKAQTGKKEYISAMIVKDGEVLYYGQGEKTDTSTNNDNPKTEKGKVNFTLPNDIENGEYTLYVFNEQINGDYKTDFSSDFQTVTLNVLPKATFTTEPTANTLTYNGTEQALVTAGVTSDGTFKYSLSENGTYTTDIPKGNNAGTYTVWYYIEGNDSHSDSDKASVAVKIEKAVSETTVTPRTTVVTYGETITLTAKVEKDSKSKTVAVNDDKVVFYLAETEDVLGEVIVDYDDNTKKDKGRAELEINTTDKKLAIGCNTIVAEYGGSVNLNNSGSEEITVTLNPKKVGLSWSGYENLVYDGNAKSVTATTTDFIPGDDVGLNITGGDKTNAGTYAATASLSGKNAEYYTLKTEDATQDYTINPKTVTATIGTILDQTYTGNEIKPTITAYDGTTVIPTSEYTVGYSNNENAGTATVTLTDNTGGNYVVSGGTTFEILPKNIDGATVGTFAAMTYNGTEQTPNATVTIGNLTATGTWSKVKNVNDTTTFTADGNFTGEISNQSTEMKKLPVIIEWKNTEGLVFDNNEKTISAEVSNIKDNDVVNLTIDGDLTGTNKGTYTATVTAVNNENYTIENGQNLEKKWVISQANDNVITNLAINGWTYGDAENTPTATAKYGTPSFTYSTEENGSYVVTVPTNAGTYWVKATVVGTEDYAEVSSEPISFTIAKAESSVTTEPAKAENLVYTGEELTLLTADGTADGGTIKYSINGTDFTYDFADIPKVINAKDDYKVWYKVVGDKNHNDTAPVCIEIKVAKKPINTAITLTAPVKYATPETSIDTDEYTATVVWSPIVEANGTFAKNTEYTATITVTPEANYTTVGIAENGYTLDGATSITNVADSNVITAVFPKTAGSSGGGGTSRYTVKFDTDGGNTITNQTVTKNSKATEPTKPTKEGYIFDGWYTDSKFTTKYDFDTKVTKNITLYAKWVEDEVQEPNDDKKDDEQKPATDEWKNPFADVTSADWFFDNVRYANENGLMSGVTNTTFAPNESLTRAMLVTVLYRAEGEPVVNYAMPFTDIIDTAYYAEAVRWAASENIVNGVTETEFAPDENITREQIATIIYRYAKYKGYDVSVGEDTNILSYTDFDEISEYAIEAMQYAVGMVLMKGKTESTLNPKDNATRAEIAAILGRFIESNK